MIRINLLPSGASSASATRGKQILVVFALVLVAEAAGLFYYQTGKDSELADIRAANTKIANEIAKLEKETKRIDELEERASELEQQQNVLNGLVDGKSGPVRVLTEISNLLRPCNTPIECQERESKGWDNNWRPQNLWIDSFTEECRHVVILGHARTNEDLAQFLHRLNTSIQFVNVHLDLSETVEITEIKNHRFVKFTIQADCVYGKSDVAKLAKGDLGVCQKKR